jgi:pyroglutamyl-peptidase
MPHPHASPTIVLTGFEPFDRDSINPSWEAARALDGVNVAGATVHAVQLPCVFGAVRAPLQAALAEHRPRLVVCLGLAGGRAELSPERIAINVDDARIPDNAGRQPIDEPIWAGAPAAYFSSLPIKAIVQALRQEGIPASVSNTAGTFVCNHAFFTLMHLLHLGAEDLPPGARGGFVHVPALPEQAARHPGMPSMALATQVAGLRRLLQVALTAQHDIKAGGGQLH